MKSTGQFVDWGKAAAFMEPVITDPHGFEANMDAFYNSPDHDYYQERLVDPNLYYQGVHHNNRILVPADNKTRFSGASGVFKTPEDAQQLHDKLKGRQGFHNLRVAKTKDIFHNTTTGEKKPGYHVEWGEPTPHFSEDGAHQKMGKQFGYKQATINQFMAKQKPKNAVKAFDHLLDLAKGK